jgi:hypothetical protein
MPKLPIIGLISEANWYCIQDGKALITQPLLNCWYDLSFDCNTKLFSEAIARK